MAPTLAPRKALQRLIAKQFICPVWVIWTRSDDYWNFAPDHSGGWRLHVEFDDYNAETTVNVLVDDTIIIESTIWTHIHKISYADPKCDKLIANLIRQWIYKIWYDTLMEDAGYPNPIGDRVR